MSSRFLIHLVFLFLAVVLTWLWTNHPALSYLNLQLIALLIIIWLVKNKLRAGQRLPQIIDALIFTLVVLLLVFSTGGAASPLFFLLYFLLFGLSFLFEPHLTLALTFILFVFLSPTVQNINEVASLLSLFLIAPLAVFFGQIYLQNLKDKKKVEVYRQHLTNEETNSLLWLTTKLKPALTEMLDKISLLLADIGHLSYTQKIHLKRLHRLTKYLLKGGEKLTKMIDQETDD